MKITIMNKQFNYYFFLFVGLSLSAGIIFSRIFKVRLPRILETDISVIFFITACFTSILLILALKKIWFPKETTSVIINYFTVKVVNPSNLFIQKAYMTAYTSTLMHPHFPEQFFIFLQKYYFLILTVLKNNKFLLLFSFYFLPQLILASIFFVEVVYFHQLKFFYLCAPLYVFSLIFYLLILKTLLDYAGLNQLELNKILEPIFKEGKIVSYKYLPKYENLGLEHHFDILCESYNQTNTLLLSVGELHLLYEANVKLFKSICMILYFFGWLHIVIFYLYNIWLFPWIIQLILQFLTNIM